MIRKRFCNARAEPVIKELGIETTGNGADSTDLNRTVFAFMVCCAEMHDRGLRREGWVRFWSRQGLSNGLFDSLRVEASARKVTGVAENSCSDMSIMTDEYVSLFGMHDTAVEWTGMATPSGHICWSVDTMQYDHTLEL